MGTCKEKTKKRGHFGKFSSHARLALRQVIAAPPLQLHLPPTVILACKIFFFTLNNRAIRSKGNKFLGREAGPSYFQYHFEKQNSPEMLFCSFLRVRCKKYETKEQLKKKHH